MLGWEFPPFITGGLGTACYGLTRALDRRGVRVLFVLPKAVDGTHAEHVTLVSPGAPPPPPEAGGPSWMTVPGEPGREASWENLLSTERRGEFEHAEFLRVPSGLLHPYQKATGEGPVGEWREHELLSEKTTVIPGEPGGPDELILDPSVMQAGVDYSHDLITQVQRYASFCVQACRHLDFDIVHAHDWMTYPAGLWIARFSGRPLVVHIHSTEFDRSGLHVNQQVYDIERRGMHGAIRVMAVSQLTKDLVVSRYGVPESRVEVVYNGVDIEPSRITGIRSKDKIVLYFGRITFQKGPEYFISAARRVLEVMKDVKFVVAGSGDMARRMIEMAAELGIGHKVLFTGFLRGDDIKRVFAMADLYVMPSISEPFGIAPLEAMSNDVPVLISKSSGVSEVLTHVLKVDFWDVNDMANKIIAVLRHPPLSQTLRQHGAFEARRLTWDGAALRCEQVYRNVVEQVRHHAMVH
jgi:glycosyltransferase involved in cell wall biosynthesis